MYSNEVLNSANSVNFYCPLHSFFQHPNSLPNSLDPSTSKLSVYWVGPIFHHYKTSLTHNHNYLATSHCFHDASLKKPKSYHSRAVKCMWLRKHHHLAESHFESGNTNIGYTFVDAFHSYCISASPLNLSFSNFILLCLQVPPAWPHSQLMILLLILLKKLCFTYSFFWKSFYPKIYAVSHSIHSGICSNLLDEHVTMHLSVLFLSWFHEIWTIFSFNPL